MSEKQTIKPPVIILASRESQGSFLAALLGSHPDLFGAPHLNLLPFEYGWQYQSYCSIPRDTNAHGLLRLLGHLTTGEQTLQSIQMARRWLNFRRDRTTGEIYSEIASLVAPRILVDYSPLHAQNLEAMRRVCAQFPLSPVIHLYSNPKTQSESVALAAWQAMRANQPYWRDRGPRHPCMDSYEVAEQFIDWSHEPPVFDPQFAWYRTQQAAITLFDELPKERCFDLSAESLVSDPTSALTSLLTHIGVAVDAKTISEMLSNQERLFSVPGPFAATSGVDFDMVGKSVSDMTSQVLSHAPVNCREPLKWRGDGGVFVPQVIELAGKLGFHMKG